MAKVLWVDHRLSVGGLGHSEDVADKVYKDQAQIITMREYVRLWRMGFVFSYDPPEWILDIFPPT